MLFVVEGHPVGYPSAMANEAVPLDPGAILIAAKGQVRRHGEAKTNVVDIARALNVSHAALYRHFASKAAILNAIVEEAMHDEEALAATYVDAEGPASDRLKALLLELHHTKKERFLGDEEVHGLYRRVVAERPDIIADYAKRMTLLIERLLDQGVNSGEFKIDNTATAAGVVRDSCTAFIHPALVAQLVASGAPTESMLLAVVSTLVRAFKSQHET
jgi:AcrR family transcriptional regulator